MVRFENLLKKYGEHEAVNIDYLEIPKGKIFGFIGPNGAGKSTTIKMMVGLLKPTKGRILINNYDITKMPIEAKRVIGYIADKPNLYEDLTCTEFVRFMAELYECNKSKERIDKRINELLDIFKMSSKANNYIHTYSHGMRQKTAIIGALIHEPELLILDEPMVGLDPQGAKALKDLLYDYAKKGNTVFISTHTLDLAEKLCDIVGIINKGQILFNGSVSEIQNLKGQHSLEEIFVEMIDEIDNTTSDGV